MKVLFIISILFSFIGIVHTQSDSTNADSFLRLESGKSLFGKVEYKTPMFKDKHILFQDSIQYSLSQIFSFKNSEGYFRKFQSKKMVKRTTQGNIDLYSDWTTSYTHNTVGPNMAIRSYDEIYFSKGKGELLPINYKNLSVNLSDNQESMRHLSTYKTLKYTKIGLGLVGLGIIISAFTKLDKEEGFTDSAKSTLITGAIVMNLAWIPHFMQGTQIRKAINAYNK